MKKFILFFAVLSTVFTACSKNNDVKDPTVSKLEVVMNFENISADVLNYFSIEYTYVDFKGQTIKKDITKAEKIAFSIDNPTLGEESSNPFKVQLTFNPKKDASEKPTGTYDSSLTWQLDVNAYDQNGNLITDSGKVQRFSSNIVYDNDKFSSFKTMISNEASITAIEYKVFYCKTISGVWHIGVEGLYLGGAVI